MSGRSEMNGVCLILVLMILGSCGAVPQGFSSYMNPANIQNSVGGVMANTPMNGAYTAASGYVNQYGGQAMESVNGATTSMQTGVSSAAAGVPGGEQAMGAASSAVHTFQG